MRDVCQGGAGQQSLSDHVMSINCHIFEPFTGCWDPLVRTGHRRVPVHPMGWILCSPHWAGTGRPSSARMVRGFSFPSIPNPALSCCCSLGLNSLCSSPDGDPILWSTQARGAVGAAYRRTRTQPVMGYFEEKEQFMTINNICSF